MTTLIRVLETEPAPSGALDAYPTDFQQIVNRCLQKNPQARYDDTTDLVRALEAVTPEPPSHASDRGQIGTVDSATGRRPVSWSPLWRWQLHQAFVAVLLDALLIPLWVVLGWTPRSIGNALFFGAVAASAVGATLRLHLWFTLRVYPSELRTQRHKTAHWVRGADWTFALILLDAAVATLSQTAVTATFARRHRDRDTRLVARHRASDGARRVSAHRRPLTSILIDETAFFAYDVLHRLTSSVTARHHAPGP